MRPTRTLTPTQTSCCCFFLLCQTATTSAADAAVRTHALEITLADFSKNKKGLLKSFFLLNFIARFVGECAAKYHDKVNYPANSEQSAGEKKENARSNFAHNEPMNAKIAHKESDNGKNPFIHSNLL